MPASIFTIDNDGSYLHNLLFFSNIIKVNFMFQLDCWDGPEGEPVIFHGWTLTSKLKFKDVIEEGIKPFAFTASNYPLILSIENHCSKVQQDRLAKHLINILGHLLYKENVDTSLQNLPSPEFFKNKILIKAKKQKEKKKERNGSNCSNSKLREVQSLDDLAISRNYEEVDNVIERQSSNELEVNRLSVSTKSELLSNIVNYTEAVKFKSFEEERKFWEMSSFNETKITKILNDEKTQKEFTQFTERNLSRIYPKGSRLLSSNLEPTQLWAAGCQMVAINFQQVLRFR